MVVFFLFCYFITAAAVNYYKLKKLKELEVQFLIGSLYFQQLKYQMIEMLKIVYEKAGETDPKFIEDYKLINISLEAKFNDLGNWWISNLEKSLGYKLKYSSWQELIKRAEPILKEFNLNDSRKRN